MLGVSTLRERTTKKTSLQSKTVTEKCFKRCLSQANELDDEDYIFEEDEDDEDEEEEKEQFCKKIWAKVHPETAPTRRTRKQVDYSGMDMNEEDIGEICVFKPWFQDGTVIEKCFRRPLSKANELDDEEYIFEEVEEILMESVFKSH